MRTIKLPKPHKGQKAIRRESRRFNWLAAGRRWRKTTLVMSIMVEAALQGGTYIWGAPTFDQARIGFEETRRASGGNVSFNLSRMTAEFPAGGRIVYRSLDNPDNVRGWSANGVAIDEAGNVKTMAWQEVLRPMLIDSGGWAWGVGTPAGRNWFWQEHVKAIDSPDTTAWQIPVLGVRIEDGKLIRAPHPYENPHVSFEEIERLWKTLPERVFRQEVLAEFVESGGGIFRNVEAAATATPLAGPVDGRQYVAGVDVAALQDFTVVSVMDVGEKKQVFQDRFNRVDYHMLEDRLEAIYKRFKLTSMTIEANSIGQPVIDALVQRGLRIIPFHTTRVTKMAAIQGLQAAFEHNVIEILNNPTLINELQAYEGKQSADGSWSYSAPPGLHDDCVMALPFVGLGFLPMLGIRFFG